MTSPPFLILVSLVALAAAGILRPQRAECPPWTHVEGRWDRCDGCYECRVNVPPSAHEPRGHEPDEQYGPEWNGAIAGWLDCEALLVDDDRHVRCAR